MQRYGFLFLVAILLVTMAGSAGGAGLESAAAELPRRGGTLVAACQNPELTSLDPAKGNQGICQRTAYHAMYDTLLENSYTGKQSPGLATSWKITNGGKSYTFKLRKATFHDGSPVTADAVKFSILRMLAPSTLGASSQIKGVIRRVKAINPTTVRIDLFKPSSAFLFSMGAEQVTPIVNPKVVAANNGDISKADAGSGPFVLTNVDLGPNGGARFTKFPRYWKLGKDGKPLPYLDGYNIEAVQDLNAMEIQLRSGDIHVAAGLSDTRVKSLADGGFRIFSGTGIPTNLGLNSHVAPFDKLLVRQAFTQALDRNAITKVYTLGRGYTRPTMLPLGVYDVRTPDYKYDPVAAKAKLTQAGFPNGFTTTITIINRYPDVLIAQLMQPYLDKIGITLRISAIDRAAYVAQVTKNTTPVALIRSGKSPEPNVLVSTFWDPDNTTSSYGNWNDENAKKAWAACQKALTISDPEERAKHYAEAVKYVVAANFWVNMGFFVAPDAISPNVVGYTQEGSYASSVTQAWLKQ
jgi:peptide/nickel transport system substrate-binding protein